MKRILLVVATLCFGPSAFAEDNFNQGLWDLLNEKDWREPQSEETYIYHSPHTTIEIDGKSYDCEFYENENRWRCN